MSKQRKGPAVPIDDEWKRQVDAWLVREDVTQAELARRIGGGVTPAAISGLLATSDNLGARKQPVRTSRLARPIARITGVPLPVEPTDPELAAYIRTVVLIRDFDASFIPNEMANLRRILQLYQKAAAGPKDAGIRPDHGGITDKDIRHEDDAGSTGGGRRRGAGRRK